MVNAVIELNSFAALQSSAVIDTTPSQMAPNPIWLEVYLLQMCIAFF